jgi:hypothetical protein
MRFKRCTNPSCERPFQVNEFDGARSGAGAPGHIICPHCGQMESVFGNSVFLVHALSPDEEKDFNEQNPV